MKRFCNICEQQILQASIDLSNNDILYICRCGNSVRIAYESVKLQDKQLLELKLHKVPNVLAGKIEKLIDVSVEFDFGATQKHIMHV